MAIIIIVCALDMLVRTQLSGADPAVYEKTGLRSSLLVHAHYRQAFLGARSARPWPIQSSASGVGTYVA